MANERISLMASTFFYALGIGLDEWCYESDDDTMEL